MRRAVRNGLLPVIVLAVAAVVGLSAYSAVAPRLRAFLWDLDIERAMDAAGIAPGMVVGEAARATGISRCRWPGASGPKARSTPTTSAGARSIRSRPTPGASNWRTSTPSRGTV